MELGGGHGGGITTTPGHAPAVVVNVPISTPTAVEPPTIPAPAAHHRRPIAVLSALVASQIAAGEVVERPASVVKELVENAIDARASRIVVELEQGGIELVRVTDDGGGIPPSELGLALLAHATSKVSSSEELDGIATMGFRGEALASIASVSRLSLRSRTPSDHGASVIEAEGERVSPVGPAAGPVGSCVSVRNLFFNTPARRKFLRTVATEQGRCADAVRDLAIAHPLVGFTLIVGGRVTLEVPAGQSPRQRAVAVLGEELDGQLIELTSDSGERFGAAHAGAASLWALAGMPSLARATAACQHVALNGRIVRDRTIQHALREAYRGLIEPGRHPTCVMLLEVDPRAVDVNVHPAKSEVRFRDASIIHGLVLRSVRDALAAADLTADLSGDGARVFGRAVLPPGPASRAGAGADPVSLLLQTLRAREGSERGGGYSSGSGGYGGGGGAISPRVSGVPLDPANLAEVQTQARAKLQTQSQGLSGTGIGTGVVAVVGAGIDLGSGVGPGNGAGSGLGTRANASGIEHDDWASSRPLVDLSPSTRPLRVHNSFLVTQDEQGMVIIDQHALHERVMFQALLDRVLGHKTRGTGGTGGTNVPVGTSADSQPTGLFTGDGLSLAQHQTSGPTEQEQPASQGRLESQRLLVPAVVQADARRIETLEAAGALLERLGIEAAPIGPAAIGVQAFPTFLFDRGVEAGPFVAELLDKLHADGWNSAALSGPRASVGSAVGASGQGSSDGQSGQGERDLMVEAALADVLDMMACKAAVKAGDALSELEVMALLEARANVERSSACPHGRPTSVRLTIRDLEKLFHRA